MEDEGQFNEEPPCTIEICKNNNLYVAQIQKGSVGGEYSSDNIEDVIEQFVMDLQEGTIDHCSKNGSGEDDMYDAESLCSIEIGMEDGMYVARIQSDFGGMREYTSDNNDDVIEQLVMDLQDEFESM